MALSSRGHFPPTSATRSSPFLRYPSPGEFHPHLQAAALRAELESARAAAASEKARMDGELAAATHKLDEQGVCQRAPEEPSNLGERRRSEE